ncbi:hypothetical protein EVG20_g1611 [Dentipellis fragilis]|uniref:Uncharacterized protein n=1 Tax=Dentipellis fragilis TaxID=205917 RepID=A0A4Y9ZC62_9AGAM|nr:hypothetical protein EVG20_g1611 [Dentipellis fragilis]
MGTCSVMETPPASSQLLSGSIFLQSPPFFLTVTMSSSSLEGTPPAPSSSSSSKDDTFVSALDDRIVRFDDECTLIPDPPPRSRRPRFTLWKTRARSDSANSDTEVDLFRISIPRSALSPTRALFSTDQHTPTPIPTRPATSCPPLARTDVARVPLRPCCLDCFTITENCILEGEKWTEKFTRAARRRRAASIDYCSHGHVHIGVAKQTKEHNVDGIPAATLTFAAVTVDEVAKLGHSKAHACDPGDGKSPLDADPESVGEHQSLDGVIEAPRTAHEPRDLLLPRLLSRTNHLSPIPSTNASSDDVRTPAASAHAPPPAAAPLDAAFTAHARIDDAELEEVRVRSDRPPSPTLSDLESPLLSASLPSTSPPSSLPRTPPMTGASPGSSPRMVPRMHAFHFPSSASLMRAGVDLLKGVNVASGSPHPSNNHRARELGYVQSGSEFAVRSHQAGPIPSYLLPPERAAGVLQVVPASTESGRTTHYRSPPADRAAVALLQIGVREVQEPSRIVNRTVREQIRVKVAHHHAVLVFSHLLPRGRACCARMRNRTTNGADPLWICAMRAGRDADAPAGDGGAGASELLNGPTVRYCANAGGALPVMVSDKLLFSARSIAA